MKKTLLSIALLGATLTMAQVGIVEADDVPATDFPHPSAALDVQSTDKGFLAPRVALTSVTDAVTIDTPKTGLLVYNSTDNSELDKGYYYWTGVQWLPWKESSNAIVSFQSDGFSVTTLGYLPIGSGDTAPETFTYGSINGTKVGCFKFDTGENANGHSYCGYDLKNASNAAVGVNWPTSFAIAKSLSGYLATATSTEEWNFIKNNLLASTLTSQNQLSAWLGFNKVTYPGNPLQFTWITGERSMVAWENAGLAGSPHFATANFEFNFADDEPNNSGAAEGCVHILPGSAGADRKWNDIGCTSTTAGTALVAFLIVEFQD